jgi:hypothetical protein|nr:MAG TPA: hypothetical protein [Caudoviricetes sp.]
MTEKEKMMIEKHMKINELYPYLNEVPMIMKYFDTDSDKMLDEKIQVLEALKAGKNIEEIPNFYDVFELLPKEGIWD